jgi:hypothetical protein
MKFAALLLVLPAAMSGCAKWTQTQIALVDQARKGVSLVAQDDAERDGAIEQLAQLRRQRLDQAFDEDVRLRATQESLDPDWVIEARRGYAAALDTFAKTQAAGERAAEVRRRNLAAVDAALARLQTLQSLQLKLDLLPQDFNEVRK